MPGADSRTEEIFEHDPEKWKPVFRKDHAQTKRHNINAPASMSLPELQFGDEKTLKYYQ